MNTDTQILDTLAASLLYKEYERAFTEASGLPVALRPLETWKLPLHGQRKENGWCALMAGKSRTCAACLQIQDRLAKSAEASAATVTCAYGFCETAAPVKLGSRTIGYLQTGQVARQELTEESFERALQQIESLGAKINKTEARDAYFGTRVVPNDKVNAIERLLWIFADHLSMKASQIETQHANAEPPPITKAKRFIEENSDEDLSLDQVAKAAHMSSFYFCKMFKKAVGMNFTEYVSRVRIAKARNLLLNLNLHISEIAYEVGFQSLTHFNRTFKRFEGTSPSDYRQRLPASN